MTKRFLGLQLIFILAAAIVSVRFFALQVLSHGFYQDLSENQHQLYETLVPSRGKIYLRDHSDDELVPVATNITRDLVYVVPPEIVDKTSTAKLLAQTLGLDELDVKAKISDNQRQWVALKKQLTEAESAAVSDLGLMGVYLQGETLRFYPQGEFASQVLGFVGFSDNEQRGQYGVESFFENELSGSAGSLSVERDAFGRWITRGVREIQPAKDGVDLVLTLDQAIQFKAQEALKRAVEEHQAERGSVVIIDPSSGAILAMADYPTFNPNIYNEVEDQSVFRNLAVSDSYEPGSVFKPITMAAALDDAVVTPDQTYEDKGYAIIDGYTIHNSDNKAHGVQTMTQVLEQSLNTGVIHIQDLLGPEKFLDTIRAFGFGDLTEIELPAESPGSIKNLIGGGDIHYATASFGQGITTTLLQLAQAYSAIANGGKLIKPHILVEEDDQELREVISTHTANTLAAMLVSVIENGQATHARVPGYYVAGKTGTAQVVDQGTGDYDQNNTIGTFVGFGPIEDPRFVVAVRIDHPAFPEFAASTAAPVFGEIAQFLVNYYQIPPNR